VADGVNDLVLGRVESPVGAVFVVMRSGGGAGGGMGSRVVAIDFGIERARLLPMLRARFGEMVTLRESVEARVGIDAVKAYFERDFAAISAIEVEMNGTPFQVRVWAELREIPVGTTTTYGEIAARLGNPNAMRAVGMANGRNPINIAVPCHRVIGANGSLVGYGGGMERKRWLLRHEGVETVEAGSTSERVRVSVDGLWARGEGQAEGAERNGQRANCQMVKSEGEGCGRGWLVG
jgi:methylated-DNA-[protein]-cysteine S-methyltransferase